MNIKKVTGILSLVLVVGGLALVARPLYHLLRWKINQAHAWQTWQYYLHSSSDGSSEKNSHDNVPVAWLSIPEMDMKTLILAEATEKNLMTYPCLETEVNELTQQGIKVILGHRDMHFRRLQEARPGIDIEMQLRDGSRRFYRVMETEVVSPEMSVERVKQERNDDWLVLMTCYPFHYIGPAPQRFLVWAKREEKHDFFAFGDQEPF